MNEDSITNIYCDVDDFCKALEGYCRAHLLPGGKRSKWFPASRLSLSGVMTIILLFHLSGYRCFKRYYHRYVCAKMQEYFPTPGQLQPVCGTGRSAPYYLCSYIHRDSGEEDVPASVLSIQPP
jgi:hypothetical protein